jgi:hypothetical protein
MAAKTASVGDVVKATSPCEIDPVTGTLDIDKAWHGDAA